MPSAAPLGCIICYSPLDTSRFTLAHLQVQFSRSRQTLLLIVGKILDDEEKANEVVASCFARACQLFRTFADEAELRRWLIRVAIDEALLIVCRQEMATQQALDFERGRTNPCLK